ncbi:RNA-binding protein [Histomonas meleagridis]|uniref:RNA-binding protein n=1 Tax=Histomonas meleagridis TaxID=135588 RepID=UPI00355A52A9|nr:RNA-binding protein [Histomonas meleagridis]KAH0798839.1 RNA-binding protein [Histomonas meleagridis]
MDKEEKEESSNEITLYVSNLPNDLTQEELDDFFSQKAPMVRAFPRKEKKTGHFSGTCFVTYKNREDGYKIIQELNGSEFKGRKLVVEKSHRPYIHDYKKVKERQRELELRRERFEHRERYRMDSPPYHRDRYYRDYYDRAPYDRYRYERHSRYYDDPRDMMYDDPYSDRRRLGRRPPSDESDYEK